MQKGYSPDFEVFWQGYRDLRGKVRLNKAGAAKCYDRALKRGASPSVILDGLERFEDHLARREAGGDTRVRDFVPMPETWLNQDRWADEYVEPRRMGTAEAIYRRMGGDPGAPRAPARGPTPLELPDLTDYGPFRVKL